MNKLEIRPDCRYAWRGTSLLIVDAHGESGVGSSLSGYFFNETRYLRTLRLEIDGKQPYLSAVSAPEAHILDFTYVHPELRRYGGGGSGAAGEEEQPRVDGLPPRGLDVRLRYRVFPAALEATAVLANRTRDAVTVSIRWVTDADFADLQEALSGSREQEAPVTVEDCSGGIRFRYAHPQLRLGTEVVAGHTASWTREGSALRTRLTLGRQESAELRLRISPDDPEGTPSDDESSRREQCLASWHRRITRVDGRGAVAALITNVATSDLGSLALLDGTEDEWLAPAAGVPLYPALFGRDAVTAGWQVAMLDGGQLLEAALTRLGRLQGMETDGRRDEQPGRVVQQVRRGPLARLGLTPFDRYYGDVASPLMYVIALGNLFAWSGDRQQVDRHWDSARRVIDWAREAGDVDGDGYIEYQTQSAHGPRHQGWKDSGGAIVYEDGREVAAPLSVCEVQGYYHAALQVMSALSWTRGAREDAQAYWEAASTLKDRFNRDFWLEEEGYVALALDAEKRAVRSIGSNAGHCLAAGIINDEHIPPVVGRLFAPDMFSGWGIRTLSTAHPSYSPLSYHLGSIWPVENATIVFGLRRFGFDARALELAEALFELAGHCDRYRIPECVGGFARSELPLPGAYPQANAPQAWNQSSFALILQAILGLVPVAPFHLLAVDPKLPTWLPEVTLHDLRIGGATATLRFYRDRDGTTHMERVRQRGSLRIVRQPPIESLRAGLWDRVGALLRGLVDR